MLRIFAPGNADTAWIFQVLHPVQPFLDTACYYLTQPVDKTATLVIAKAPFLLKWLPLEVKASFPIMPASVAARHIADWLLLFPHDPHGRYARDLLAAHYNTLFPGVVDWRLMFALPIWSWAESIGSGLIKGLETLAYKQSLRNQDRATLQELQEQWIEQNPPEDEEQAS